MQRPPLTFILDKYIYWDVLFRSDIEYTFGKSPSRRDLSVCFFLSKDTNTEMPSVKEKAKATLVFITRFCN